MVLAYSKDVSLEVRSSTLVGEGGSGKSVTSLTIMNRQEMKVISGDVTLNEKSLLETWKEKRQVIRRRDRMIFQDPTAALDPLLQLNAASEGTESLSQNEPQARKQRWKVCG